LTLCTEWAARCDSVAGSRKDNAHSMTKSHR
jgi:hypothetical protein